MVCGIRGEMRVRCVYHVADFKGCYGVLKEMRGIRDRCLSPPETPECGIEDVENEWDIYVLTNALICLMWGGRGAGIIEVCVLFSKQALG